MRCSEFHRNRCSFGVLQALCAQVRRCRLPLRGGIIPRTVAACGQQQRKQLQLSGAQEWSGNRRRQHGARKKRAGGGAAERRVPLP
jgi:hypothetical protein